MFGKSSQENYADIRPWVKTAVSQEKTKPQNPMWKGEPSEEKIAQGQQKRIRFLFKHGRNDPEVEAVAKRLEVLSLEAKMSVWRVFAVRTVVAALVRPRFQTFHRKPVSG